MRIVRVSIFIILAVIFALIGISPRKMLAQQGAPQNAHQVRPHRRAAEKAHIAVKSIKPAVTPGATGLVAIPIFTDDKQTPMTGGPALTIPLFNASTTNTITISGVTIGTATVGQYSVTTNCTTLAPGATCNVVVTFISPSVCGVVDGLIEVANNDPVLDGLNLEIEVEGWGSDGNFQIQESDGSYADCPAAGESACGRRGADKQCDVHGGCGRCRNISYGKQYHRFYGRHYFEHGIYSKRRWTELRYWNCGVQYDRRRCGPDCDSRHGSYHE